MNPAAIDGPRIEPGSGQVRRLVVFLHGYGADGNDLIDIGRAWSKLLPDTAFVSPHAPYPCDQSPYGRQWFPLSSGDAALLREAPSPRRPFSMPFSMANSPATPSRRPDWPSSDSAREP